MKKTHFILPLVALGMIAGSSAQAQTPSKVGVIQVQSAIVSTRDGQKAAAELDAKMAPKKKELDQMQAEIKDLQDRLARGGTAMSDSAKEDLTRSIDAKTKSYNRDVEDAQADLNTEQQKLLNDLGGKMMQVIDKYATANGYSVILDVSNPNTPVMYASNSVDITKDIIDLYDKASAGAATPAATKPAAAAPAPKPVTAPAAPKPAPVAPAAKKP